MKFLKKASLAASIAAVSFAANAELVAMDEMSMAAATGQAGIDIDVSLTGSEAISIGEVLYRDTDTDGGLSVSNITLGSANGSTITLFNKVDIAANGDIVIDSTDTSLTGMKLSIGGVYTVADDYAGDSNNDGFINSLDDGVAANLVGATDIFMNIEGGTSTITQTGTDTVIEMRGGSVEVTSDALGDTNVSLLNNAVTLGKLQVYGTDGVGSGISTQADLTFNENGVSIGNLNLAGTIKIGELGLGGVTTTDAGTGAETFTPSVIGSLEISNIVLNGAQITISGH
jgi:hypothetical protein